MEEDFIKESGTIKSMTSGGTDILRGRNHHEPPKNVECRWKTILIGNKFPKTSEKVNADDAVWKRIVILLFKNKIPPGSITLDYDFPAVFAKYYEPEASRIFNWALKGLIRYNKNKRFSFDGDAFSMWHADEGEEMPFEYFIDTYFDIPPQDEISKTPTELVRELCKIYCNEMKEVMPSEDSLGRYISNLNRKIKKTESRMFTVDKSKIKVYNGIIPKQQSFNKLLLSNPDMHKKYMNTYQEYYMKYSDGTAKPIIM